MKILLSSAEIENAIIAAMRNYSKFYWTVAWAGIGSKSFEELLENRAKIEKMVIGTHFYQTNPNFIAQFIDDEKVKFKQQTSGIFHPKLYLFANSPRDWLLIVGSANFTKSAFENNTEVATLILSSETDKRREYEKIMNFINEQWADFHHFTIELLDKYRIIWKTQQNKISSLSGLSI